MSRKSLGLVLVVVAVVSVGVAGCAPEKEGAEEVEWTLNSCESSYDQLGVVEWQEAAERISARTDGNFQIRVVLDEEIGISREQFPEVLGEGTLEMAHMQSAQLEAVISQLVVFSLPYLTVTQEDCAALAEALEDIIVPEMREMGFMPVTAESQWYFPPQEVIVKERIQDWSDLDERKIRVWRSGDANLFRAIGAEPVYMSFGEVYMALKRGVIDGVNTSAEGMLTGSLFEAATHYYDVHFPRSVAYDVVSVQHWEDLPDGYKEILQEEARVAAEQIRTKFPAVIQESVDRLASEGVEIHELSASDRDVLTEAARPLWEEWAKEDPANQEAYQVAKDVLGV